MNEDLNKMPQYKDKKCIHCNRSYPETLLNIEGYIHHNEPYRCIDVRKCNKAKKQLK